MSVRSKIEKKIQDKQDEIVGAHRFIAEASAYIQALQEVLKLHPKNAEADAGTVFILRSGSEMAKAREVIDAAGRPIHISEILKGLGKEDTPKNRASVSGSLSSYARKGKVFMKSGANTFGLLPKPETILEFNEKSVG